jgi:hypothetical protein
MGKLKTLVDPSLGVCWEELLVEFPRGEHDLLILPLDRVAIDIYIFEVIV